MEEKHKQLLENDGEDEDSGIRIIEADYIMDYVKNKFLAFLDQVQGKQMLVYDEDVQKIINLIEFSFKFKQNDVQVQKNLTQNRRFVQQEINYQRVKRTSSKNIPVLLKILRKMTQKLAKIIQTPLLNFNYQLTLSSQQPFPKEFSNIIFLVSPTIQNMERIDYLIRQSRKVNQQTKDTRLILTFWPQRSNICRQVLSKLEVNLLQKSNKSRSVFYQQILNDLEINEFSFDLIPLAEDLLSYQMNSTFRELYLENNFSYYYYVVESIIRLQTVYGKIPNIFCQGQAAIVKEDPEVAVKEIFDQEMKTKESEPPIGQIETLIIFDRKSDLLTPLLKQVTFNGMTDENFEISGPVAKIPKGILSMTAEQEKQNTEPFIHIYITSKYVYPEIRDRFIYQSRIQLGAIAEELKQKKEDLLSLSQRFKQQDQTKQQSAIVTQLTQKVLLTQKDLEKCKLILMTNPLLKYNIFFYQDSQITEHLIEKLHNLQTGCQLRLEQRIVLGQIDQNLEGLENYVSASVIFGATLESAIRLLLVASYINNGIDKKKLDEIQTEIMHNYGMCHAISLLNFQKLGLLSQYKKNENVFRSTQAKLKRIYTDFDENNPDDPAFAYAGYVPLVSRYVEQILQNQQITRVKKELDQYPGGNFGPEASQYVTLKSIDRPAVLVFVIGGVTQGEIATLRWLGQKHSKERRICSVNLKFIFFPLTDKELVIMTTNIINHQKLIKSMMYQE